MRENGLTNSNGLLAKNRRTKECWHIASFRNYPGSSATDYRLIAKVRNIPGDRGSFLRASVSLFFSLYRLFGICFVPNDQSFPGPVMNSMRRTGRSFLATFLPHAFFFGPSIQPKNHRQFARQLYIRIIDSLRVSTTSRYTTVYCTRKANCATSEESEREGSRI